LTVLTLDRPALVVYRADGRIIELQSAGNAGWRVPETGEALAASWGEMQGWLTARGVATPGHSGRHLDLVRTEGANRDRLTLGLFEYDFPRSEPPRPAVAQGLRPRRDRPIDSVMTNADETVQIGYAAAPRPPATPAR
jgi:hypothetical protein